MHLDYAGIRVTNLAKTKRFLVRALGLVEVRRGRMAHGGVWVLFRDPTSHQQLELNWYPKGSKYATPFVAGEGLDHLGVRVQDLASARKRLLAAGARPLETVRWRGQPVVEYFEGPDGLWVELILSPTP